MPDLGAILTAMVTPFGPSGEVDEDAAIALMRHLTEHGSDGLVVSGTTGESPTLTDAEKLRLFELAVETVGSRGDGSATVVAGTGSNDTAHSVHLTAEATKRGVDAVLAVTPYYNKPPRQGLIEHFGAIAAATEVPVVIYNIPSRCVINLPPDLLAELAEVPNITAVKQANPDLDEARRVLAETGLELYAGNDDMLFPVLEMGGRGGVCVASHVVGDEMGEMARAAEGGEVERAREIDQGLQDVYRTLFITSNPILTKAALNLMGHPVGGLRLPLVEATEAERDEVRGMLERHGLLEGAPA